MKQVIVHMPDDDHAILKEFAQKERRTLPAQLLYWAFSRMDHEKKAASAASADQEREPETANA